MKDLHPINMFHHNLLSWRKLQNACKRSIVLAISRPPRLCSTCGRRHASSWTSKSVRTTFTDYFSSHGHKIVPSSSVIPRKGEGTYFTNAGMNQFKPIFLGECLPSSPLATLSRAANSQKCIRVGGKHNDLDDVGHDLTHHTFFEMLGNWSFGDYFKNEACFLAYELLTKHYQISPDRLYFTYFAGDRKLGVPADEEVKDIWLSLGIPKERVLPFDVKDNFWDMGETGPCGPCTEIHYDHLGGRLVPAEVNTGSPDLVEIWNLVFMQYNRLEDGSLQGLPAKHVDTGMGLERLTALLNSSADNYSTDLFIPIFDAIKQSYCGPAYGGSLESLDSAYRILADHIRMTTVALSDGLLPSSDNLGHKLRSILHRCILLCRDTFKSDPHTLLPALVDVVVDSLSCPYPDLMLNKAKVCDVIRSAVDHHDKHREMAAKSFRKALAKLDGNIISGDVLDALERGHYGSAMSVELISEFALTSGLKMDMESYSNIKANTKASTTSVTRSQDSSDTLIREMVTLNMPPTVDAFKHDYIPLNETQYDFRALEIPCKVCALSTSGVVSEVLEEGQDGEVVLAVTSFYAEGGGQEGDSGQLIAETGRFVVCDTQSKDGFIIHRGHLAEGSITTGQTVQPSVSVERRQGCMYNHTATHLLNSALDSFVPGSQQQGSSITPYKFTFDFLALKSVSAQQIEDTETAVRNAIKQELKVSRQILPLSDAMQIPRVRMMPDESYPDMVSVVYVGGDGDEQVSAELCGGTHVMNTGHLTEFCITQLKTKSQNVKRAMCVTGREAQQALLSGEILRQAVSALSDVNLQDSRIREWEPFQSGAVAELKKLVLSRQERLQHSLECTSEYDSHQQSRLKDMLTETDKTLDWIDSMNSFPSHSVVEDDIIPYVKHVVATVRKGKDLELMQKTARDAAESYLNQTLHKLTEAINSRMLTSVVEIIRETVAQYREESSLGFFVHKDFVPRQMVKVFKQDNQVMDCGVKELYLAHFTGKNVTVVYGVKGDDNTKQHIANLLHKLDEMASTKGKQVSVAGGDWHVYNFSINSRSKSGQKIDKIFLENFFDTKWFDAESGTS